MITLSLNKKQTGPPSGGGIKGANAPTPRRSAPPAAAGSQAWGRAPRPPGCAPAPSRGPPCPLGTPAQPGLLAVNNEEGIIVGERQRSPLYLPERACTSCRVHSPVLAPGFFSPSPEHFSVAAKGMGTPTPLKSPLGPILGLSGPLAARRGRPGKGRGSPAAQRLGEGPRSKPSAWMPGGVRSTHQGCEVSPCKLCFT